MNISVKFKALLLVSTMMLVSLGGYALLLLNMATMEQEYNEQTKTAVEQSIRTEAEKINTYMALVQEGAAAIAIAGQNLRHVQQGHEADLGDDVAAMLKASLTRYPEASDAASGLSRALSGPISVITAPTHTGTKARLK